MSSIRKNGILFACTALLVSASATVFAEATDQRRNAQCRCAEATERQVVNNSDQTIPRACKKDSSKDVSWRSWLVGDSRSTQFHYLDLLELLFRNDESGAAGEPPSYK